MGRHGARTREGSVTLSVGWHDIRSYMFQNGGGAEMIAKYSGPDTDNKSVLIRPSQYSPEAVQKKEDSKVSGDGGMSEAEATNYLKRYPDVQSIVGLNNIAGA